MRACVLPIKVGYILTPNFSNPLVSTCTVMRTLPTVSVCLSMQMEKHIYETMKQDSLILNHIIPALENA